MDILQKIVANKHKEIALHKKIFPQQVLEKTATLMGNQRSLKQLLDAKHNGVIAEFKRKSPSKQNINVDANLNSIVTGYAGAGAVAVSVLTDMHFFGGSSRDLINARTLVEIPLLRKDFIVDPYQVFETRALGADVMLLIAAALTPEELKSLARLAKQIGLEVLLEVHTKEEVDNYYCDAIDFVGVNNRNLKTFEVSIQNSLTIKEYISKEVLTISESGLSSFSEIETLMQAGFNGFLIGEQFMKQQFPDVACAEVVKQINGVKVAC